MGLRQQLGFIVFPFCSKKTAKRLMFSTLAGYIVIMIVGMPFFSSENRSQRIASIVRSSGSRSKELETHIDGRHESSTNVHNSSLAISILRSTIRPTASAIKPSTNPTNRPQKKAVTKKQKEKAPSVKKENVKKAAGDKKGKPQKGKKKDKIGLKTLEEVLEESRRNREKFEVEIKLYLKQHEERCKQDWMKHTRTPGMKPLCDCVPKTLVGYRNVTIEFAPLNRTLAENPDIKPGGHWEPKDCTARYKVVIIVPFRDRDYHLSVLLRYLHPALRGQQLNYTILVVEQNLPEIFNKASLMNIAYVYAREAYNPDCVIFHDVDMIPEDGRHFYTCRQWPLHLGAYHTRHEYRLIYSSIFGSVTSFRPETFEKINGFSNRFFGWGGEDDDMSARLRENRLRIARDPRAVAGYRAITHTRDKGNVQLNRRSVVHKAFRDRDTPHDGLKSLHYVFQKRRHYPLYTWLFVDVVNDETKIGIDL